MILNVIKMNSVMAFIFVRIQWTPNLKIIFTLDSSKWSTKRRVGLSCFKSRANAFLPNYAIMISGILSVAVTGRTLIPAVTSVLSIAFLREIPPYTWASVHWRPTDNYFSNYLIKNVNRISRKLWQTKADMRGH